MTNHDLVDLAMRKEVAEEYVILEKESSKDAFFIY
jgi:hypothetical protein